MKKETVPYLKKTFSILMAFWTFAIGLFLTLSIIEEKNTVFSIAAKECKTGFVKDVQYRLWGTKHGGVYVPQSEDTPPNPYLSHIPERDITTPSGKKLTLMNPAYMTRQVFEISKERFGYKGHITSLNPLRKENSADDWEKKSLTSFEHGVKEVLEIVDLNGEPHIRFMSPFIIEKGCLKCHASQGYKVGEIRGGISISLPWKPFNKMFWSQMQGNLIRYIGIWLIGICGLVFAYKKMKINISDKERLNEEVKNNERMLDSLLNGIKESALLIDVNGKVLAANNTVDDRINSGKRDIVGKNVFDLLNSDVAESRRRYIEEVIRVRKALQFEDVRNGRVINNSLTPVLESNGTVSKIALIGFDITTQRENEKALKESENKFRALIEDSTDVITLIDATGTIIYESPSYQKVMGYSVNERIGKYAFDQLHPDDRENILGLFKEVLLSTNWITLPPTRVLNADGTYHWIEGTVNNKISDPNIGGIIINYRDITEKKKSNDLLESALQQLKYHVENTPLAVIEFNSKYQIIQWSLKAEEMFGWKAEEVLGKNINEFKWVVESDEVIVEGLSIEMASQMNASNININQNYRKDGSVITCAWYNSALHNENGEFLSVYSLVQDITEEVTAQKLLSESERSLKESQRIAHLGHWTWETKANVVYWSDEMKRIFGLDPNDYNNDLSKIIENLIHPEDREIVIKSNNSVLTEKHPAPLVYRIVKAGDDVRYIWAIPGERVVDNFGNIIKLSGIVQDITELKQAQIELEKHRDHLEELIQERTKELDSANLKLVKEIKLKEEAEEQLKELLIKEKELSNLKSRFISTASHEFRTPLASLSSSTELIQRYKNKWDDNKINEHLNRIMNSAAHLTKLMDDVISINRAENGKIVYSPEECNLYEICKNVIEYLNLDTNENIKFHFSFEASKRHYILDEKQIKLVLNNLLSNAVKYSNNDGTIMLKIQNEEGKLVIKINDEGIGIPEEDLPRLFEPFYRASNTSNIKGSGLGLSIVKHAVDLHGGTIQVNSKQGVGTNFTITLPITM